MTEQINAPEFKEIFAHDGERVLSTLSHEAVERVEALVWARRVLLTKDSASFANRPAELMPLMEDVIAMAAWILGYWADEGDDMVIDLGEPLGFPTHEPEPSVRVSGRQTINTEKVNKA